MPEDRALDRVAATETAGAVVGRRVGRFVIVGDGDFLLEIKAESTDALHELFQEEIQPIRGVAGLETRVVIHTAKETIAVPVSDRGDGATGGSRG